MEKKPAESKFNIKHMAAKLAVNEATARGKLRKAGLTPAGAGGAWGWDSQKALDAHAAMAKSSKPVAAKKGKKETKEVKKAPATKAVAKPAKKAVAKPADAEEE